MNKQAYFKLMGLVKRAQGFPDPYATGQATAQPVQIKQEEIRELLAERARRQALKASQQTVRPTTTMSTYGPDPAASYATSTPITQNEINGIFAERARRRSVNMTDAQKVGQIQPQASTIQRPIYNQ